MAVYRARWFCPARQRDVFRDFHSKGAALRFQALPRENVVEVEHYKEPTLKQA